MIKPITFPGQKVPAIAHGAIFQRLLSDGKLYGCGISKSGSTLNIGAGLFVEAGRLIEILTTETISVTGTAGYARIKGTIDSSKASTASSFAQFSWTVDYAASLTGFSALTQGAVNEGSGATYEMEICVVALGSNGIADIVRGFADTVTIIAAGAVTGEKLAAGAPNTAMAGTRYKLVNGIHYGTSVPSNIADDELFFLIGG